MQPHSPIVAVIGASACTGAQAALAEAVGRLLAERGAILVCGGLGGVMEAACRGAQAAGGTTIGLLPGEDPRQANPYVTLPLPTGLGHGRNALVVLAGQAIIAIGGGGGTLSEIGLGLRCGRPVIGLGTWGLLQPDGNPPALLVVETPEQAVALALDPAQMKPPL